MDNEIIKHLSPYIPFIMSVNGKAKINYSRFVEMALFASIMVVVIRGDIKDIKIDINKIIDRQQELSEERVKTNERLKVLEKEMLNVGKEIIEIKKIVYKPIKDKP